MNKGGAFGHDSNEGNSHEVKLAAAEIALFTAREYPNGSCRAGKRAILAVALVTSTERVCICPKGELLKLYIKLHKNISEFEYNSKPNTLTNKKKILDIL
jgi:hypothetical protein